MIKSLLFMVFLLSSGAILAAESLPLFTADMMTVPEKTDYQRTSTHAEVLAVVNAMRSASKLVHYETLLTTQGGREIPVLILANPPISSPEAARQSGKPIVYLQANIHGGEVEGKEASLIAMRDILFGDKPHLLEKQILIFVPIYNADGNDAMSVNSRPSQEMSPTLTGARFANGFDLNRDGMAVETLETKGLYRNLIQRWDPDVLVDLHTTNGTWHGYSLTYAPSYHTAGDPTTSAYTMDVMLPAIAQAVKDKFNLEFGLYGGFDYRNWPPTELRTYHHAPRYLTNHMGLRNRMAILSETFAHDRFYKRIHAANVFVEEILEFTNEHGQEIRRINKEADQRVKEKISSQAGQYHNGVQFEMIPLPEPSTILSYTYIPYSTANGETRYARSAEIVEIENVANYNRFTGIHQATVPKAYIFPAELSQIATKLREHGIVVDTLPSPASYTGEVFQINQMDRQNSVQNNHRNSILSGSHSAATREYQAGDFYVSMENRLANLIFYLLEAESDDGLAYWNFFDEYLVNKQQAGEALEFPVFKVLD